MHRKFLALALLVLLIVSANAQNSLQSPEQYLGYKLGDRYTLHYKIVNYFSAVASALPAMVKLEKYGETYEGRPLMLAFVSSAENMQALEAIRMNNMRLALQARDRMAPNEDAPVIVWLSYNVHGNEPSSSEAAMKTLYELVNPQNAQTKEWLKNTVVVIDPCINPDGRDRYANWFTSVANKTADADPQSREHREPWPGGRTNHYNFDLNRDWAWQSQVETQHRIKRYNEWLPHVHVDFHEQGFNNPYYFAPAAEPYHEVITPWQREFQVMIGKNHAKYFDANGWLYFTKERFDLFYPSYGDTYPTYQGAIGMTYEQGGHSAGGLAVRTADGDTLTLADRLEHHFTTGLSTIEISSKNATRVIKEFRKFYSDAVTSGSGEYKTYVIKTRSTSADQTGVLEKYLSMNGIDYGFAQANVNAKGYNYISAKDETFTIEQNDIIVSAYQPKSNLVRVLMEPKSKISDSATYDITAWSLPYAIGLEAFGVREKISLRPGANKSSSQAPAPNDGNAYAYVIPWKHTNSAKVLARLLNAGIKVRYAEQKFSVNGRSYDPGTLIVTKAANKSFGNRLSSVVNESVNKDGDFRAGVEAISSGFVDKGFDLGSDRVRFINKPRVALVTGEGVGSNAAGEIWHFFERQLGYPLSLINQNDLSRVNWKTIDVLIMPDGFYRFLNDKAAADELKNWIQQGGRLVALENAVSQLSSLEWAIKKKKEEEKKEDDKNKDPYTALKRYENREKDFITGFIPGAVYKVDLDNSHPLAFGYPDYYFTLKQDDNIYDFFKEGGWNVGIIKKENYVTGFAGSKTKLKLKDGLLFGVQDMGRGNIVYLSDDVIFRSFWENGKLMLCNAVFMVGQ
ncbi:MAG: M14 family metallopeptidase [Chitinophagaceae bacterium]|nr:M14 family metallopeptidase [Chitinophagaceae bacterium]